jgi:hypothetical protein
LRMYIFGRDVLLKIEGYNYRNGEPTDFRDPVTFFVNIVYPNTRPFLNSVPFKMVLLLFTKMGNFVDALFLLSESPSR